MSHRVVLVSGGSSGMGLATARACAARGDHVLLMARAPEALHRAAEQCRSAGAESVGVYPVDVGDDAAVGAAVERMRAEHGQIDAVVHSAGVVAYGRTEEQPAPIVEGVVRTNLIGSVNVVRHVLPAMRDRNQGTIVLMGSVIGHIAVPGMTPYAVSKWGVRALARQLQVENRDKGGVHIVYLSPGGVDTPIYLQGANILGTVGRPPPPVDPPERIAEAALRLLDSPRQRVQVGRANNLMRLGFNVLPWLYDRLVGPLFPVGALAQNTAPTREDGNVLEPNPALERLRGEQGPALAGIVANVRAIWRSR